MVLKGTLRAGSLTSSTRRSRQTTGPWWLTRGSNARPHEFCGRNEKRETLDKAHAHVYLHVIRKTGLDHRLHGSAI
jgi:hypothetical protein